VDVGLVGDRLSVDSKCAAHRTESSHVHQPAWCRWGFAVRESYVSRAYHARLFLLNLLWNCNLNGQLDRGMSVCSFFVVRWCSSLL